MKRMFSAPTLYLYNYSYKCNYLDVYVSRLLVYSSVYRERGHLLFVSGAPIGGGWWRYACGGSSLAFGPALFPGAAACERGSRPKA